MATWWLLVSCGSYQDSLTTGDVDNSHCLHMALLAMVSTSISMAHAFYQCQVARSLISEQCAFLLWTLMQRVYSRMQCTTPQLFFTRQCAPPPLLWYLYDGQRCLRVPRRTRAIQVSWVGISFLLLLCCCAHLSAVVERCFVGIVRSHSNTAVGLLL